MSDKELSKFWNKQVPDKYKHFLGSDFDKKLSDYHKQVDEKIFNHLPLGEFSKNDIIVDWGVGGGLFSSKLSDYGRVIAVDIAQSSLREAERYLAVKGKKFMDMVLVDELENAARLRDHKLKMIFSVSVIQHFISLDYWRRVAALWKKLSPEYIALQTRHGDKNEDNKEKYFLEERNYILGLRLTSDEVKSSFQDGYGLVFSELIDDKYSMYEYFIFKKKAQ